MTPDTQVAVADEDVLIKRKLAEIEQIRKQRALVEADQKRTKDRQNKRLAIPPAFLDLQAGEFYVGYAQFITAVVATQGGSAKAFFRVVNPVSLDLLENPLDVFYRSIAYVGKDGWMHIFHAKSGEALDVPMTNVASVKRLEEKLIPKMLAQHPQTQEKAKAK